MPGSHRRDARRRWSTTIALVAAVAAVSSVIGGGVASADAMTCKTVSIPVALTDGGTPDQRIQGELCAEGDPRGRPVQVLVHGFSIAHDYWSLPGVDPRYSYVAAATARGYTTLAVDRLGVGGSSKPAATAVTMDSNVTTIHGVVAALRAGAVTGAPAPAVVLVGHSFGSAISVTEAGRYGDVDAVVATSFMHTVLGAGPAVLVGSTYPPQLDLRFAAAGLPAGYVTTLPGSRSQFYDPADTDPAVIAADERTKGTGTVGEYATFAAYFSPLADGSQVRAPVLLAIGDHDPFFCAAPLSCADGAALGAREAPFFARGARLTGYVLPGAGHNMALERNSPQATAYILAWVDGQLGHG